MHKCLEIAVTAHDAHMRQPPSTTGHTERNQQATHSASMQRRSMIQLRRQRLFCKCSIFSHLLAPTRTMHLLPPMTAEITRPASCTVLLHTAAYTVCTGTPVLALRLAQQRLCQMPRRAADSTSSSPTTPAQAHLAVTATCGCMQRSGASACFPAGMLLLSHLA
jgi:hypothetical protein